MAHSGCYRKQKVAHSLIGPRKFFQIIDDSIPIIVDSSSDVDDKVTLISFFGGRSPCWGSIQQS
jgi:hypothetical protein